MSAHGVVAQSATLAEMLKHSQFSLADEDLFAEFSLVKIEDELDKYNYCPDCKVPMLISESEYQCEQCGLIRMFYPEVAKESKNSNSGGGRVLSGGRRTKYYNVSTDYARTQRKAIETQLRTNNLNFAPKFADEILMNVAAKYNQIQKLIVPDGDTQKKFVRRGNIKDEVLASLIYFECMAKGATRKKKDIAAFMRLPANGFSRGEEIVLSLHACGLIELDGAVSGGNNNLMIGFVDRYLEALNITEPRYREFVIDIVKLSEEKRIGMDSHLSSKIVGAIWMLICQYGLPISATELEKAADNTKRNTFMRFQDLVRRHAPVFMPLLRKHNIDAIRGRTTRAEYN